MSNPALFKLTKPTGGLRHTWFQIITRFLLCFAEDDCPCLDGLWCNGIVTYGAPVGGIQVFDDHTCRNKTNQNASMIFAHRAVFHTMFIFTLRPQYSDAHDKSRLSWSREKPEYPNWSPCAWIKMVQVLGSPVHICGCNL